MSDSDSDTSDDDFGLSKPEEPDPDECCGSGCNVCVWDIYNDRLEKYEQLLEEHKERKRLLKKIKDVKEHKSSFPSNLQVIYHQDDGSLTETIHRGVTKFVQISNISEWIQDEKVYVKIEMDLQSSEFKYTTGDVVCIWPPNDPSLVNSMLTRLQLEGSHKVTLQTTSNTSSIPSVIRHAGQRATIEHLFKYFVDLKASPSKNFLLMMSHYTDNKDDKQKLEYWSTDNGDADYRSYLRSDPSGRSKSLVDILLDFPSCTPPISHILDNAEPMKERHYSISSSASVSPLKIEVALNVVKEGQCSSWLHSLCGNTGRDVLCCVKPSLEFSLISATSPLLLFSHGTSITPMRAIIQDRYYVPHRQTAETWLFYGTRYMSDYLYKHELEAVSSESFRLIVAASRDQSGHHVQDRILEQSKHIAELLLSKSSLVYVCGSSSFAETVFQHLSSVIQEFGILPKPEADQLLRGWQQEKRYLQELWG